MPPSVRHEIVGLPDAAHRLRIAHLSDFHLWFSDLKLRQIEPLLAAWKPDVLALTGDYADTPTGRRLALAWIQRMAARYPLCWVAGNHDLWWGSSFVEKLAALPLAQPINRRDALIAGKTGRRYRFTSWERISAREPGETVSEPTVVLLHNPANINPEELPCDRPCLLLAGHLHGGQINLWHDRHGRPQPAASCYARLFDRGEIGSAPLIVSRGMGDTLPIRIQAPKEIVLIEWATV